MLRSYFENLVLQLLYSPSANWPNTVYMTAPLGREPEWSYVHPTPPQLSNKIESTFSSSLCQTYFQPWPYQYLTQKLFITIFNVTFCIKKFTSFHFFARKFVIFQKGISMSFFEKFSMKNRSLRNRILTYFFRFLPYKELKLRFVVSFPQKSIYRS